MKIYLWLWWWYLFIQAVVSKWCHCSWQLPVEIFFLQIYIEHNIENTESENQLANLLTNGRVFLSSNISLFRITCCEHVLVKIHCLQNRGRRYAWCRWTRLTPWLPPPRPPSSLVPRCDHMRHVIIYNWWVLTTVDTASSVRKFGRVTIPSLWKLFQHQLKSLKLSWGRFLFFKISA